MPERSRITRNRHAVALGRRGGRVGGKARAMRLSPAQRSESARNAARARWGTPRARSATQSATRERILGAARAEFLRYGLNAARLERIARAAGVNKRMIYYYFDSKDGLFREMLRRSTGVMMQIAVSSTAKTLYEEFLYWENVVRERPQWLRLMLLEALASPSRWVATEERRQFWRGAVMQVEDQQKRGELPRMDAAQLQLTLLAVVMFPYFLPQFAEFVTGMRCDSDAFFKSRKTFFRDFVAMLR